MIMKNYSAAFLMVGMMATTTPISINLDIEPIDSTLFIDKISDSSCTPSASSTQAISGYCAVLQSGLEGTWSSFGDAQFLDSVGGIANDYENNLYWGWFSNLEYGQTSLDQHILTSDENLLITLGKMPLQITVPTTTPSVSATTTVSVTEFGFDESWSGVWSPSVLSSVHIAGETFSTDSDGHYDIFVDSDTPLTLFASKDGFVNSNTIII